MENQNKLLLAVGAFIFICVFVFVFIKLRTDPASESVQNDNSVTEENTHPDLNQGLKDDNDHYRKATELIRQKDYNEALAELDQAKATVSTVEEKAIIDFTSSEVKFQVDRSDGIASLSALSKTAEYPERTRALAMLRAFLNYYKYSDEDLLKQLASEQDIPWTITDEVAYQYMRKIVDIYPFPFPRIWMIGYELNKISDPLAAQQLFETYKEQIESGLEDHKAWSGERTEYTSSMGAYARLQARLALQYNSLSREEVESTFQSLIDFDHANGITVNKQYTLIFYADFLTAVGDYEKATTMLRMILDEGVDPVLSEGLPKLNVYGYAPNLLILKKKINDAEVISFIETVGKDAR